MIGGVSASDVTDMSNNPDNNNFVSDSSDFVSVESIGNYYTNQLSNEDVSSSVDSGDLSALGHSNAKSDSSLGSSPESSTKVSASNGNGTKAAANSNGTKAATNTDGTKAATNSNGTKAATNTNASKATASSAAASKNATSISVANKTVYSGNHLILTLKDKNGKLLKGKKVLFNINGIKKYTGTTNSNGQVKLVVNLVGSRKAIFSFAGDSDYNACKLETTIKILKSNTNLKVLNRTVPRTTYLIATLTNGQSGRALANQKVIFKVPKWHNKKYTVKTDANGQAKLAINTWQKVKIDVLYAGNSNLNKTNSSIKLNPIKCDTKFAHYVNFQYGKKFVVALRKLTTNEGVAGRKVIVHIVELNKTYRLKTNKNGKISIPMNYIGNFTARMRFVGDDIFNPSYKRHVCHIVKGATSVTAPKEVGLGYKYIITLKNSAGTALANKNVIIKINNKVYNRTTNSKGQVTFNMNLKKATYPIEVNFAGNKYYNSSKIKQTFKVVDPYLTMAQIISAAKELKTRVEYINLLNKSYSVTVNNKKFTMDEFAYLMAGAISHLNAGSKARVTIKDLSNNYKSTGSKINGKLTKAEYLKIATYLTKFVGTNKRIPNFKTVNLGKMEADLYIYAFTCVLTSYNKNKKLPASISVKTNNVRGGYSYSLSQGGKILNCREIFDSTTFAKYLKNSGKSAVNDAIKNKAKSLTKGLTNPLSKAIAIFRYVRDNIQYSFYSNSLKGATGTFSSKSGNCCDKANLIVAMCRSVGVYARYSHAQGCKFQSGLYTGHVWAQVYDTNTQTWYTADATSYRNEVGTIKNWNTGSHYRDTNYVQIPF